MKTCNNSNINTSEFTFNIDNSSPSISIASNAVLNGSVTNQNSIYLFISNVPVRILILMMLQLMADPYLHSQFLEIPIHQL